MIELVLRLLHFDDYLSTKALIFNLASRHVDLEFELVLRLVDLTG
jgi:hypothetical protein